MTDGMVRYIQDITDEKRIKLLREALGECSTFIDEVRGEKDALNRLRDINMIVCTSLSRLRRKGKPK